MVCFKSEGVVKENSLAFSLRCVALCALALACALLCAACSGTDEALDAPTAQPEPSEEALAVREDARALVDRICQKDEALISQYLDAVFFDVELYGVDEAAFVDAFFEGFSCDVLDVRDLADGSVEVEVLLTTYNGQEALGLLVDAYRSADGVPDDLASLWADLMPYEQEEPYLLRFVQADDGSWEMEDEAAFGAALLGGYDPRQMEW